MAHENVVPLRVGFFSSRRFAHPPRTVAAPTPHFCSPSLTHCSLPASGIPVLVTLSAPCQLECVNFRRRTPAQWRQPDQSCLHGVQNWLQRRRYALSPDYCVQSLTCWPCSFCFFPPTCLPCPRCFVNRLAVRLRCLQQDR